MGRDGRWEDVRLTGWDVDMGWRSGGALVDALGIGFVILVVHLRIVA